MSDPVMKELLHNIAASKAITTAAVEQGRIMGRREMKPLIRELLHMLDIHGPERDRDLADVFKRAKVMLEND